MTKSHVKKLEAARKLLGDKLATHPASTFKPDPFHNGSQVLTAWRAQQILARAA